MARSSAVARRIYGSPATRLVGAAIKYAPRVYSAAKAAYQSRSSGKQSVIQSGIISTQHDVANRYRKKRMPRRKRKAWGRFSRKVKHVMLQMNALQSFTSDNYNRVITWAAQAQATFGQMLGGVNATDNDELLAMFKSVYGAALGINSIDKYKLFIKALCLDIQLRNTGASACIVDVYELVCRTGDKLANRIEVSYTNAFNEQSTALVGGKFSTNPATTPFQNPLFTSMWRIVSKKEMLLGGGQITTMQMRMPYNKMFYGKKLENNEQAVPGFTRAYLFQVRGVPENLLGVPQLAAGELVICSQVTGSYNIPPGDTQATTGQL